jgi:hypothetical protein
MIAVAFLDEPEASVESDIQAVIAADISILFHLIDNQRKWSLASGTGVAAYGPGIEGGADESMQAVG